MGRNVSRDVLRLVKEAYALANENQQLIYASDKKNAKMVNDLRTTFEQANRKGQFDILE